MRVEVNLALNDVAILHRERFQLKQKVWNGYIASLEPPGRVESIPGTSIVQAIKLRLDDPSAHSHIMSRYIIDMRMLKHNGETRSMTQWAKEIGIAPSTLSKRVKLWGVTKALSKAPSLRWKSSSRENHGLSKSPEYKAWSAMLGRCLNPFHPQFPDYGGRSISVCSEWRNSFLPFLEHIGKRPYPKAQLDRIDNDGSYEPGNVKWSSPEQNGCNKRNNRHFTHNGQTLTIAEWVRHFSLNRGTLNRRIAKGWSVMEALTVPARKYRKESGCSIAY